MKDNTISLEGNVTADPELRFTPSGMAVTTISVAHNTRMQNEQGQWVDGHATFVDVVCWQKLAEHVSQSVTKGSRVMIVGRLSQRDWIDQTTNQKRYKLEVVADAVGLSLRFAPATAASNRRVLATASVAAAPDASSVMPEYDETPF